MSQLGMLTQEAEQADLCNFETSQGYIMSSCFETDEQANRNPVSKNKSGRQYCILIKPFFFKVFFVELL